MGQSKLDIRSRVDLLWILERVKRTYADTEWNKTAIAAKAWVVYIFPTSGDMKRRN